MMLLCYAPVSVRVSACWNGGSHMQALAVSHAETNSFIRWNCEFQALKLVV